MQRKRKRSAVTHKKAKLGTKEASRHIVHIDWCRVPVSWFSDAVDDRERKVLEAHEERDSVEIKSMSRSHPSSAEDLATLIHCPESHLSGSAQSSQSSPPCSSSPAWSSDLPSWASMRRRRLSTFQMPLRCIHWYALRYRFVYSSRCTSSQVVSRRASTLWAASLCGLLKSTKVVSL